MVKIVLVHKRQMIWEILKLLHKFMIIDKGTRVRDSRLRFMNYGVPFIIYDLRFPFLLLHRVTTYKIREELKNEESKDEDKLVLGSW